MKKYFASILLSISMPVCAGTNLNCYNTADLTEQQHQECLSKKDTELQTTYNQLIDKLITKPSAIESLKKSQRLWTVFRETECNMTLSSDNPTPSETVSLVNCKLKLTQERIEHLKTM